MGKNNKNHLTKEEWEMLTSKKGLRKLLDNKDINIQKTLRYLDYAEQLEELQVELIKLQQWVSDEKKRVAILFEGRDVAGKGGTIRRFAQHLIPRSMRIVALPKPNLEEKGQWYFRRYIKQLPNAGEIVFFDRSWYNRAVVEPVMNFCSESEYNQFMKQVTAFEHMLYEDGLILIKFWFSISKEEQSKRFQARKTNPLKQWKFSEVDAKAQNLWDQYTFYRNEMLAKTHTDYSPWMIIDANNKKNARLESMRYVLSTIPYKSTEKPSVTIHPDPDVVQRYHRDIVE